MGESECKETGYRERERVNGLVLVEQTTEIGCYTGTEKRTGY